MTTQMQTLDLAKGATLTELEALLAQINADGANVGPVRLRSASSSDGGILADVWSGIVVGTAARLNPTQLVAWGLTDPIAPNSSFAATLPFMVGLSLAESIMPDGGDPIDRERARKYFANRHQGVVDPESGLSQMLVEFDPDYRRAQILSGRDRVGSNSTSSELKSFEMLILEFRQRLEIGALRRRMDPQNRGPAGDLGKFLFELYENGLDYGSRGRDGKTAAGTRLMRIKKHVANNKKQLIDRCGTFEQLRNYAREAVPDVSAPALIEATISDFGLGIVDSYSNSPAGSLIELPRRELLEQLVYGRLSSKSGDPSAGLGIQKALDAARRMNGFVSLRTAEFWLTASFAGPSPSARLRDVGPGPHPRVAGTHWQLLWLQP
jgi:hypothetical protein